VVFGAGQKNCMLFFEYFKIGCIVFGGIKKKIRGEGRGIKNWKIKGENKKIKTGKKKKI